MEGHQVQPGSCLPTAGHPPCGGDDINRSAHVSRNRVQQATAISREAWQKATNERGGLSYKSIVWVVVLSRGLLRVAEGR